MRRIAEILLLGTILTAGFLAQGRISERSGAVADFRPVEEFFIVPVRVHLIRSDVLAVGTRMTREDIERIFRKANGIWHAAGIHLWVESIVEEKPAHTIGDERFTAIPDAALLPLRPADSRAEGMFHVYYVRAMVVNGIYKSHDAIFVQEVAQLRPIPGGIDEPLPRVTSHELGHGLSLPHRQDRVNLMASGTTGTSLNEEEIHNVRRKAESLSWVETTEGFLNEAVSLQAAGKKEQATSRFRAIIDIPGSSPLKDRARGLLGS